MKAALVFLAFIVVAFASGGTLAQPEAATILQEAKIQFSRPLCASKKIPGGLLDDVVSGVASGVAGALVAAAIAGGDVAARTKPVGGGQAAAKVTIHVRLFVYYCLIRVCFRDQFASVYGTSSAFLYPKL
jgi:hypothetical protein